MLPTPDAETYKPYCEGGLLLSEIGKTRSFRRIVLVLAGNLEKDGSMSPRTALNTYAAYAYAARMTSDIRQETAFVFSGGFAGLQGKEAELMSKDFFKRLKELNISPPPVYLDIESLNTQNSLDNLFSHLQGKQKENLPQIVIITDATHRERVLNLLQGKKDWQGKVLVVPSQAFVKMLSGKKAREKDTGIEHMQEALLDLIDNYKHSSSFKTRQLLELIHEIFGSMGMEDVLEKLVAALRRRGVGRF